MGTNTGVGIGIGIPFKNNALGGDRPYLPPELKARLIGVWDNYGKKNTDADRNIIKNKIPNAGGDLEILNSAYRLNSGFGGYSNDFQEYTYNENVVVKDNTNAIFNKGGQLLVPYSLMTKNIPSFKIKVSGLSETYHFRYYYRDNNGVQHSVNMAKDGNYELPICYNVQSSSDGTDCGFANNGSDIVSVEILPKYEGAFVTDGVNDMIVSQNPVSEMLGGSNEITVVSMTHKLSLDNNWTNLIGELKGDHTFVANRGINTDKTGIYGYTYNYNENAIVINNILGDKNDYIVKTSTSLGLDNKYYVTGFRSAGIIQNISQIAWYWTFIANRVLTTDEINQVIAYYNLDRTLKPDILCNITKQGITNDNHAEFNDKLIDYSGNGRDIQTYNLAWKGGSGIAAKPFETIKDYSIIKDTEHSQELTIYNEFSYKIKSDTKNRYWAVQSIIKEAVSYPITIITDKDCVWVNSTTFTNSEGNRDSIRKEYPVLANTPTQVLACGIDQFEYPEGINPTTGISYVNLKYAGEITVTFIPSCKGGLLLDGVNDFGKVTGMPIYKDYTFIIDRQIITNDDSGGIVASKSESANDVTKQGAFIFEYLSTNAISTWSYYKNNSLVANSDSNRNISYQSKYSYNGKAIEIGEGKDSDKLWIGTIRDNDERFANIAIYSLMSFPYSMSEFLIERQLKKHKLGTLYPNMVEFRPVIKANANYKITYYQIDITNTWKSIKVGDYIVIGAKLAFQITFDNDASELKEVVSPQLSGIIVEKRPSNPGYNIYSYITSKSPQKINITIDEYIRFEDIVQPYPVLLRFNDENGNEVSWGGKFRVGSTITRIGSAADSNLLPNIYNIFGLLLNGNQVTSSKVIVEKTMVFKAKSTYIFDNNEPKCILSPRLLRIPNSSYKILGYIPDISGHGNNGVIHNSAYAEGSGVNEDGSYQLDGVDDFVTIPTIAGKQVLIKLNWQNKAIGKIIYDQRDNGSTTSFAIVPISINDTTKNRIAYQERNANGITYIDGIRNEYIESYSLKNIIHNITITNPDVSNKTVVLGASNRTAADYFAKYALYDFMLFDEISTDDKIKELNEYVGIEAKVELPPYYWDAYGKTNLDADKATIQQRGVAVGDYDLTNTNFAYDKMSGFGGYEFEKFTDKTKWIETKREDGIEVIEKNDYSFTAKKVGTGQYFWDFKNNSIKTLDRDLTVKAISNNNVYIRWEFKYRTAEKPDIDSAIILLRQAMTPNVPITVTLPYKTQEEQTELGVVEGSTYYLFYFDPSDIPVGDEYTVEMLPLYPNGLLYDAVTDYSENVNIPVFTDFTAIMKRKWLKNQGCPLIKGSKVYEGGNGNALLFEWDKAYNFVFYKRTDIMEGEVPDNISFITPTNYNGNVITRGSEQDTNGICIAGDGNAGFANMVFYKLILYPKTIPLLQINFLKNLMERDEIIDLTNPIFIKDE